LDWLEFRHVDLVLADERRDFAGAPARVLVRGEHPVIQRVRFEELIERAPGLAFVRALRIVHEFVDAFLRLTIPDRKWKWVGGHVPSLR
jgi:hypothetical protein